MEFYFNQGHIDCYLLRLFAIFGIALQFHQCGGAVLYRKITRPYDFQRFPTNQYLIVKKVFQNSK